MKNKTRAAIYRRVSTTDQKRDGYSLNNQQEVCRERARQLGYDVVLDIEESESAYQKDSLKNRPGLAQIREACCNREIDAVIVLNLSRLSRRVKDQEVVFEEFKNAEVDFQSCMEPNFSGASGRLMRRMFGNFAEWFSDQLAESTTGGMQASIKAGGYPWPAPLGYTKTGNKQGPAMLHDDQRAKLIQRGYELVVAGATVEESLREVTRLGLRERNGKVLYGQHWHKILRHAVYAGRMICTPWKLNERGRWEPIVDPVLWQRVQDVLSGKGRTVTYMSAHSPELPLRGYLLCSKCGRKLTGSVKDKRGVFYRYYHCKTKGCGVSIRAELPETAFLDMLRQVQPTVDQARQFCDVLNNSALAGVKDAQRDARSLQHSLATLRQDEETVLRKKVYGKGLDARCESFLDVEITRLTAEIAAAEARLHTARHTIEQAERGLFDWRAAYAMLGSMSERWNRTDHAGKQRFLRIMTPTGLIYENNKCRTADNSSIFKALEQLKSPKSLMAAPRGVEPL